MFFLFILFFIKAVFVEHNGPIDPNTGCHPLLLPGDLRMFDQR